MCVWAEEMRREIMWNENSGCYWLRRRLLCQNPTKKSQVLVSLSRWMESGGSHREDKKVKVKIALKWNTIALKKKKKQLGLPKDPLSAERSPMSASQIILITAHPSGRWCHGSLNCHVLAVPCSKWLPAIPTGNRAAPVGWHLSDCINKPLFVWTLHIFSWLSGTNPSGLRLELLGCLSRPNYAERHFFFFFFSAPSRSNLEGKWHILLAISTAFVLQTVRGWRWGRGGHLRAKTWWDWLVYKTR